MVSFLYENSTHLPDCDILFPYWACWRGSLVGFHAGKSFRRRISSTTSGTGSILLQNKMFFRAFRNTKIFFSNREEKMEGIFSCEKHHKEIIFSETSLECKWSFNSDAPSVLARKLLTFFARGRNCQPLRRILQNLKMFTRFSNSRKFTGNGELYMMLISSNIKHCT